MKASGRIFFPQITRNPLGGAAPANCADRSRRGNDGTLNNITPVQLPSGLWVHPTNGSTSYIDCGTEGLANAVQWSSLMWLKAVPAIGTMAVERGTHNFAIGQANTTINLATPVPVGHSFVMVESTADAGGTSTDMQDNRCVEAYLKTQVGDNWTQLYLIREEDLYACTVEWQVITGDEFTVQDGDAYIANGSLSVTDGLSPSVDRSKTFLVASWRSTGDPMKANMVRCRITSTSQLTFDRTYTAGGNLWIHWYAVTLSFGSVQYGTVSVGTSATATLSTPVSLANSFVIYTYMHEGEFYKANELVRQRLTAVDTVTFDSYNANVKSVSYFVVECSAYIVERGTTALGGGSASTTQAITPVDMAHAFVATIPITNVRSNTTNNVSNTACLHRLTAVNQLTFVREIGGANSVEIAWEVVRLDAPAKGKVLATGANVDDGISIPQTPSVTYRIGMGANYYADFDATVFNLLDGEWHLVMCHVDETAPASCKMYADEGTEITLDSSDDSGVTADAKTQLVFAAGETHTAQFFNGHVLPVVVTEGFVSVAAMRDLYNSQRSLFGV